MSRFALCFILFVYLCGTFIVLVVSDKKNTPRKKTFVQALDSRRSRSTSSGLDTTGSTDIIVESSGDLNWRLNKKEKKSKRKKLKKNSKIRHAKTNNKEEDENADFLISKLYWTFDCLLAERKKETGGKGFDTAIVDAVTDNLPLKSGVAIFDTLVGMGYMLLHNTRQEYSSALWVFRTVLTSLLTSWDVQLKKEKEIRSADSLCRKSLKDISSSLRSAFETFFDISAGDSCINYSVDDNNLQVYTKKIAKKEKKIIIQMYRLPCVTDDSGISLSNSDSHAGLLFGVAVIFDLLRVSAVSGENETLAEIFRDGTIALLDLALAASYDNFSESSVLADIYSIRGKNLVSTGDHSNILKAIKDFNAAELILRKVSWSHPDITNIKLERGMAYYDLKWYNLALADAVDVINKNKLINTQHQLTDSDTLLVYNTGKNYIEVADYINAIALFTHLKQVRPDLAIDINFEIAHCQSELQMNVDAITTLRQIIGSCYIYNSFLDAVEWVSKKHFRVSLPEKLFLEGMETSDCVQRSAEVQKAHQNLATMYQNIGDTENAVLHGLSSIAIAESRMLTDIVASLIVTEALQSRGDYNNAIKTLQHLQAKKVAKFIIGYLQAFENVLWTYQDVFTVPFENYCFDRAIHPIVKVAYLEVGLSVHFVNDIFQGRYSLPTRYKPYLEMSNKSNEENVYPTCYPGIVEGDNFKRDTITAIIAATQNMSHWVTRDRFALTAFPTHKRKLRMFPLAVLEMAQWLNEQVSFSAGKTDADKMCNDRIENSEKNTGSCGCTETIADIEQCRPATSGRHIPGWRDFFQIGVRWRSLSEPSDKVFWVDNLPSEYADSLTGSSTNMFYLGKVNLRYQRYVSRVAAVIVRNILNSSYGATSVADTTNIMNPEYSPRKFTPLQLSESQHTDVQLLLKSYISTGDLSEEVNNYFALKNVPLLFLNHLFRMENVCNVSKSTCAISSTSHVHTGEKMLKSAGFLFETMIMTDSKHSLSYRLSKETTDNLQLVILSSYDIDRHRILSIELSAAFSKALQVISEIKVWENIFKYCNAKLDNIDLEEYVWRGRVWNRQGENVESNSNKNNNDGYDDRNQCAIFQSVAIQRQYAKPCFPDQLNIDSNDGIFVCSVKQLFKLKNDLLDAALDVAFYWHILNPLTRGSAMLGYMAVIAIQLAAGIEIIPRSAKTVEEASLPDDAEYIHSTVQMDLEAITALDINQFKVAMKKVFSDRKKCDPSITSYLESSSPRMRHLFPSARHIISVLNENEQTQTK